MVIFHDSASFFNADFNYRTVRLNIYPGEGECHFVLYSRRCFLLGTIGRVAMCVCRASFFFIVVKRVRQGKCRRLKILPSNPIDHFDSNGIVSGSGRRLLRSWHWMLKQRSDTCMRSSRRGNGQRPNGKRSKEALHGTANGAGAFEKRPSRCCCSTHCVHRASFCRT